MFSCKTEYFKLLLIMRNKNMLNLITDSIKNKMLEFNITELHIIREKVYFKCPKCALLILHDYIYRHNNNCNESLLF